MYEKIRMDMEGERSGRTSWYGYRNDTKLFWVFYIVGSLFWGFYWINCYYFHAEKAPSSLLNAKSKYDIWLLYRPRMRMDVLNQWISRALTARLFLWSYLHWRWQHRQYVGCHRKISKEDSHIKGFRFNRNYGKSTRVANQFPTQGDVVL